MKDESGEIDIW